MSLHHHHAVSSPVCQREMCVLPEVECDQTPSSRPQSRREAQRRASLAAPSGLSIIVSKSIPYFSLGPNHKLHHSIINYCPIVTSPFAALALNSRTQVVSLRRTHDDRQFMDNTGLVVHYIRVHTC